MFHSLRRRLIVSHVLPLLIIIPLMGIALIYVLESQVLLTNISNDLLGQALLLAEVASDEPHPITDPAQAQAFVTTMDPYVQARLMVLDAAGHLLASTDLADQGRIGELLSFPGLSDAVAGTATVRTTQSRQMAAEVVDVVAPVYGPDGRVVLVVRLTHRLVGVYEQFLRLRYLIVGVLGVGLVLGAAVGWALAVDLARPLRQLTDAVGALAQGQEQVPLVEQGPDEIRDLLRAVNSFVERLQTLERSRRQLLANLVHELGRPLGSLRSAIQALQGGADQDAALRQELLAGMDGEIGRLRRLLDDLAHLHDQVVGQLELACRPTAMTPWLVQLLATRRPVALDKGLRWHVTVPPELPELSIDPDRLGEALDNLVGNAIKYTPRGGEVTVTAGQEDGNVWIKVADTGTGISHEEQDLVFVPFYRSRRVHRFPQGMGLGLTIARDLVAAHGGRLDLESSPGIGSTFTIWLPVASLEG